MDRDQLTQDYCQGFGQTVDGYFGIEQWECLICTDQLEYPVNFINDPIHFGEDLDELAMYKNMYATTDEEYQKMIDADKSVKRLSAYTTRQRELAEIENPEERNPKHAGRPKKPYTEKAQSKAIRVIGSIADDVKAINDFVREHPDEEDRVKFLLGSVVDQLK